MPSRQQAKSNRSNQSTTLPGHHMAQEQSALSPVQALGNSFMQSMQPKLNVNAPNDSYEQEADRMASQVTTMGAPAVQRADKGSQAEKKKQPEKKQPEKKKESVQKKPLATQVTPLVQRATKELEKKQEDLQSDAQGMAIQRLESNAPAGMEEEDVAQTMPLQRKEEPKKQAESKKPEQPKKSEKPKKQEEAQKVAQKMAQTKRANPPQLDDDSEKKKPGGKKGEMKEKKEGPKKEEPKKEEAQRVPLQRAAQGGGKKDETKKKQAPKAEESKKKEASNKKKEEAKPVQKKGEAGSVPTPVERDIERQEHGGRPLDTATRQYFEPRFGADFSNVRVHDDAEATRSADQLNAQAFTRGEHLFFGSGRYQPNDSPGRQLLAHELTHTLQQGATRPAAAAPAALQRAPIVRTDVIQRAQGEGADDDVAPGLDIEPEAATLDDETFRRLQEALNTTGRSLAPEVGKVIADDRILFDRIKVPKYKLAQDFGSRLGQTPYSKRYGTQGRMARPKNYIRNNGGEPKQRDRWRQAIPVDDIERELDSKVGKSQGGGQQPAISSAQRVDRYVVSVPLKGKNKDPLIYMGTKRQLARIFQIPKWGRGGHPAPSRNMQVEHLVELQIGNWSPENKSANEIDNMILLDGYLNRLSGGLIREDIRDNVRALVRHPQIRPALNAPDAAATPGSGGGAAPSEALVNRAVESIKQHYHLEFSFVQGTNYSGLPGTLEESRYWTKQEIEKADQMEAVEAYGLEQVGSARELFIFTRQTGGRFSRFRTSGEEPTKSEARFLGPLFPIARKQFMNLEAEDLSQSVPIAKLTVQFKVPAIQAANNPQEGKAPTFDLDVMRLPGARYAGFVNLQGALRDLKQFQASIPGASPIEIDEIDILDSGLFLRGRILPDVPLLRGTHIDWELEGDDLRAIKTFTATDISVPAPLEISSAALTLSAGTRSGVSATGRADFGIQHVGTGFLEAKATTKRRRGPGPGFALAGGFDFDSKLFDPAHIEMRYEDGEFSGEGEIGIPRGKLRGVREANLKISYAQQRFTAEGTVQPAIPGVREGTLGLVYSEQEGLVISGSLQLEENPAIRSGSIEARVERKPDGSYKVRASGTAQPKIPGVNSQINVAYDDGAFDAGVAASFSRGMLSGTLNVAATNRPIDEATGQPAGEPTDEITVYGGGEVKLRFSPWLEGTVGLRLLPNGEIEVNGAIGLPSSVPLFNIPPFKRNIFNPPPLDIPIVGVSVLGQRIGIFATIRGSLDAHASIGPGQLRNLSLNVTYNPNHEDQTHVVGQGELYIPAQAGLKLAIKGGLGAGIPVVSASAGIEVAGELGLQGEATAAATIDWTPQKGIVIDALGSITVEPKLKVSVNAYVDVEADLLLGTVDLYNERWKLAEKEFGSNLRFGVHFPIHYQEDQPFSLSTDRLAFDVPDIDPMSVVESFIA